MTSASQELQDLRKRLEWLDEERRKSNRRLAELEQRLELQTREVSTRDQRIQSLEKQLSGFRTKLTDMRDFDIKIEQVRKDLSGQIDQIDNRRVDAEREIERLRQVDRQITTRELSDIRKELPQLPRIQNDLEQRRSEEVRLSQMIGAIQNRFPILENRIDTVSNGNAYTSESAKQTAKQVAELQTKVLELQKQREGIDARVESNGLTVARYDGSIKELQRSFGEIEKKMKAWFEQVRVAEFDRNQRVDGWQGAFQDYKDDMAKFHQQWLVVHDRAKETKTELLQLAEWRKQIELQMSELTETQRMEVQRMFNRWDDFTLENDKFWKNVDVDIEQRATATERRHRQFINQLEIFGEQLEALRREKDLLRRVQNAQTDAMKKFPSVWLDELEKAVANDPERRRQPTRSPVPDEFEG